MIVLDTNVLSERLKPYPDQRVVGWLREVASEAAITSITVSELIYGVRRLPSGRRQDALSLAIEQMLAATQNRLLPYDERAARVYAEWRAMREAQGRPLPVEDGMIAGICHVANASLATRNTADFAGLDIEVVNPWA